MFCENQQHESRTKKKVALENFQDVSSDMLHSPPPEKLHPQQSKHHNEEKEQKQQADDGLHGAHEGHNQVPEGGPVSDRKKSQTVCLFEQSSAKIYTQTLSYYRPHLAEMLFCFSCECSRCSTYLVILKILRSLSALSTLIPNDMPGLKKKSS